MRIGFYERNTWRRRTFDVRVFLLMATFVSFAANHRQRRNRKDVDFCFDWRHDEASVLLNHQGSCTRSGAQTRTQTHMHAYKHTHSLIHTYTCINTHIHNTHTSTHMYTRAQKHARALTVAYTRINTCKHVCRHAHKDAHTPTHTTHTKKQKNADSIAQTAEAAHKFLC